MVTILIPIYNVEHYIAECADSLFAQTYPDIEYVFMDDCTPDNSLSVLQQVINRYPERQPHVRIVRGEHNMGIGGVRRRLVSEVQTAYFCFVDSDDILPKDAIATMVSELQKSGADFLDCAYSDYSDHRPTSLHTPFCGSPDAYLSRLLCQNVIKNNLWAKLFRTEILSRVPDLFVEGINYTEDFCAMARIAAVARRAHTDRVVYWYRTDNQLSYTKNVSLKDSTSYFHACRQVLRFYRLRGHLPLSLEIGLLNIYRECHRQGIPVATADDIAQYIPEHLSAQFLRPLLTSAATYPIGDILYRILRRVAR